MTLFSDALQNRWNLQRFCKASLKKKGEIVIFTLQRPRKTLLRSFMLALLFLGASGCGGGRTGNVSGKVLLNGKPVPGGYVNFFPTGEVTSAKTSPIQEDGSYSVPSVPVGKAKITVQGVAGPVIPTNVPMPKGMEMPRSDRKTVDVPAKYSTTEQSGLTFDVKPGSQEFIIELK